MPFEAYPEPAFVPAPNFAAFLATLSPGSEVLHQSRGYFTSVVRVAVVEDVTARHVVVGDGVAVRRTTRDHAVAAITPEWTEWLDAVARQRRILASLVDAAKAFDQTLGNLGNPGAPAHRLPPDALDALYALDVALRAFLSGADR